MSTYYQYSNYTKKEIVSLSDFTFSIKYGAFSGRASVQVAIFNILLGFNPYQGIEKDWVKKYIGRWQHDDVLLEADCDPILDAKDIGEEFLLEADRNGELELWLESFDYPAGYILSVVSDKRVGKRLTKNRTDKGTTG